MKRKIWKTLKAGSFDRLKLEEESLNDLAEGHLRIEVKAIGLNFADIFAITGLYSATPKGAFIPGLEFSGVVSEINDSQTAFNVGDRVFGVTRFGSLAR